MNDILIEAKDVKKTLGKGAGQVQALCGVSLGLRKGELTLLMGPSGSGKTTLLLILGCMLTPSSGTVTVCGASTADADKEGLAKIRRDHIGFVFQSYHLFPTLNAGQMFSLRSTSAVITAGMRPERRGRRLVWSGSNRRRRRFRRI